MSKTKKTKEGQAMDLLRKYLPLENKAEMGSINLKFQQLFNYRPPDYEEKRKICQVNKEFMKKLGNKILKDNGLTNQIDENLMYRCMSKNIALFKYVIVTLENSEYSNEIKQFAQKSLSKPLPIPLINTIIDKNSVNKNKASASENEDSTSKEKNSTSKNKDPSKDENPSNKEKNDSNKNKDPLNKEKLETSDKKEDTDNDLFSMFFDDQENGTFLNDDSDFGYIYYYFSP